MIKEKVLLRKIYYEIQRSSAKFTTPEFHTKTGDKETFVLYKLDLKFSSFPHCYILLSVFPAREFLPNISKIHKSRYINTVSRWVSL